MMNVLLITIDSLRADFIGTWNEECKGLTPNIDKFANESIVFKNAFSSGPYTWGAFASLFTSKYSNVVTYPSGILKNNYPNIPEILKDNGYMTIGINSNPFLSTNAYGYTRGLEIVKDRLYPWSSEKIPAKLHLGLSRIFRLIRRQPHLSADETNKRIFEQLNNIDRPFFLWVLYMDTHGPYQSKKGFNYINKIKGEALWQKAVRYPDSITESERKDLIKWYKEEVSYLDEHFGYLYEFIEKKGMLDNTIILFCSDHGDGFYEHGFYSHPRFLYDELIHVPLMIRHPSVKGKETSTPVGTIDIVPTVLDMLEIENNYKFDGESLAPLITGEKWNGRGFVISDATPEEEKTHISIRTDKWKLIINENTEENKLYNLKNDTEEKSNLYDVEKEVVEKLTKILLNTYTKKGEQMLSTTPKPELDSEVKQRLKDLGYL
jgi:arylsulfatase A-like enzyme